MSEKFLSGRKTPDKQIQFLRFHEKEAITFISR